MNRAKVLIFALIALGLLGAQVGVLAPLYTARVVEAAGARTLAAPSWVATQLESSRSSLHASALRLAASTVVQAKSGKVEAPSAERLNAVRDVVFEGASAQDKAVTWVGLWNEAGALSLVGTGEAAPLPEGLDVKALTAAAAGAWVEFGGARQYVVSVPVWGVEKGESKQVGAAWIGRPVLAQAAHWAETVGKALKLSGVAILVDRKVAGSAGAQKGLAERCPVPAGETGIVSTGPSQELGPLGLPFLTGGEPPAIVGGRGEVGGSPVAVCSVVSTVDALTPLANTQKSQLFMMLGLLLAGVVVTLLMGRAEEAPGMAVSGMVRPLPPEAPRRIESSGIPAPITAPPAPTAADFAFVSEQKKPEAPAAAPPAAPPPPKAPAEDDEDIGSRTSVYPASLAGAADPMSLIGGASGGNLGDDEGGATRVAMISQDLLNAASSRVELAGAGAKAGPGTVAPKVAAAAAPSEDDHWREVFADFVATKEKCGEPADAGFTFEKFSAKLRKNKEQLVAKYNCKTVRFQVYVKEGKAALKATPVKD